MPGNGNDSKRPGDFVFDTSGHDVADLLLLLQGLRGLFVESIPEPAEVRAYFKSIQISELEKKEALEGVGLIWRVTPKNEAEFVDYFTSRGLTNILSEWKPSPEDTFPIVDFESIHPHSHKIVGWDVGAYSVRRAVLRKAFEQGVAQMTPKVQLNLPEPLKGEPGFIVYLPIFDGGVVPETLEERKAKFLGYVFGSFNSERLFRGIMAKREPILNLEVFDGEMAPENLLYDQDKVFHPQEAPVQFASTIWRGYFWPALDLLFFGGAGNMVACGTDSSTTCIVGRHCDEFLLFWPCLRASAWPHHGRNPESRSSANPPRN